MLDIRLPGIGERDQSDDDIDKAGKVEIAKAELKFRHSLAVACKIEFIYMLPIITWGLTSVLIASKLRFFRDSWFTGDSQVYTILLATPIIHLATSLVEVCLLSTSISIASRYAWSLYNTVNKSLYISELILCCMQRDILGDLTPVVGFVILVAHMVFILITVYFSTKKNSPDRPVAYVLP